MFGLINSSKDISNLTENSLLEPTTRSLLHSGCFVKRKATHWNLKCVQSLNTESRYICYSFIRRLKVCPFTEAVQSTYQCMLLTYWLTYKITKDSSHQLLHLLLSIQLVFRLICLSVFNILTFRIPKDSPFWLDRE